MSIEITMRNDEIGNNMHKYAKNRAEELMAEFPKIEHVHIILNKEKFMNIAEVVVQASHIRSESDVSDEKMPVAIDSSIDKIEKQLRKQVEKMHDHRSAQKHSEEVKEGAE